MNTIIRLKIKKEVSIGIEKKILGLKGYIIAQSFTDIIHIDDAGEEFYNNYFTIELSKKTDVTILINSYIQEFDLNDIVTFLT